jgi:hypothetical protein
MLQWVAVGLCVALAAPSRAVPSFARQTGMACAACHTVFPELTPFGREFKLNGYVLDNIKQVTGIDTSARQTLALNSLPPISFMAQISYTHTKTALPDSAATGALAKDGGVQPLAGPGLLAPRRLPRRFIMKKRERERTDDSKTPHVAPILTTGKGIANGDDLHIHDAAIMLTQAVPGDIEVVAQNGDAVARNITFAFFSIVFIPNSTLVS